MNRLISLVFVLFIVNICTAQKLNITGTVKDSNNNPVPLASITIEKTEQGVAADNTGHFSLSVSPNTKIVIAAVGFKDTVVTIKNETSINIILKTAVKQLANVTVTHSKVNSLANDQIKNEIFQAEMIHYKMENNLSNGVSVYEGNQIINNRVVSYHVTTDASSSHIYQGSSFPEFQSKEDTKGSIYLFNNWLKGLYMMSDSNIVDNTTYYYNINKITGEVSMTTDFKLAFELNKSQIQFFTFFDSANNKHTFIMVPEISNTFLCEVIALGNNYDIFKLTTAKFVKANFKSDGITSSGNNYDEYVNTTTYYLFDISSGTYKDFTLKKKSVIAAFGNNESAQQLIKDNKNDIDENFLKNLIDHLN